MSFTYSVIGDNTPENREWLEKLGYKDQMIKGNSILYACKGIAYTTEIHYPSFRLLQKEEVLDYRNNPALFRAVTAMREDSDYLQWFTDGVQFIMFDGNDFVEFHIKMMRYHKATLAELQEHFK